MVPITNNTPSPKPAISAIVTGGLIALVGYVAAAAQGMATAPSDLTAIVAMAVTLLGFALALMGIASIWLPRLRRPARAGNYVALSVLVFAFLANQFSAVLA